MKKKMFSILHGNMTTSFERSAIIGFWRCGAQLKRIATIMKLSVGETFRIIYNYFED